MQIRIASAGRPGIPFVAVFHRAADAFGMICRYTSIAVSYDFSTFDAVLLDLDGTIYHEDHPLPGAVELIRRLERENRKYACLTNSGASPRQLEARLARLGIRVEASRIYSCPVAAADYVLEHFRPRPRVFSLGSDGLHELLDGHVHWVEGHDEPCDVVVVAAPNNRSCTPQRQWIALQHLRNGSQLIGQCADRVYPSPRGIELGAGALTMMFAYAAHLTPVFCGKPEPLFFHELCQRLGVRPERCVLIGDNLESDIAGARNVGMSAILTLSGVARTEDVERARIKPDYIIGDLRELI